MKKREPHWSEPIAVLWFILGMAPCLGIAWLIFGEEWLNNNTNFLIVVAVWFVITLTVLLVSLPYVQKTYEEANNEAPNNVYVTLRNKKWLRNLLK